MAGLIQEQMASSARKRESAGVDTGSDADTLWDRVAGRASTAGGQLAAAIRRHKWEVIAYALVLAVALTMRLWDLGSRAMHHDESLHAYYSYNLSAGLGYQHIPMMHGPFQIEASAAVFRVLGDSEFTARLLYAVAGTVLVGLPALLRGRLGRTGAFAVAVLLALSPTMLYYSRFARNDILMAVWALGLVICMWRYVDEGKTRYLLFASGLLAFAFATKENSYLVTATLGLYLVLLIASQVWPSVRTRLDLGGVSPPVAMVRVASGMRSGVASLLRAPGDSRPLGFLALLVTLSLPLWAALVSVLQDTAVLGWSNLVLASPVGGTAPIGAPLRGGIVVAAYLIIGLVVLAAYLGLRWNASIWWRAAVIFYGLLLLMYTTSLTNPNGIGSGLWQSLGYWVVQQGEARGGQPWYYYLVIAPVYEFLPLFLAVIGAVFYLRRRDGFGHFLVFWAVTTFALYTVASEKMPWLLVNVSLPIILLAGRFLGEVVDSIEWRRLTSGGGLFMIAGVPLFLAALYSLAFYDPVEWGPADFLVLAIAAVVVIGLVALGVLLARGVGRRNFASFALLPLAGVLLILSVRAAWYASYENGDVPVEMIVYTQTSPDIARLVTHVREAGGKTGDPTGLPVTIDGTSGFNWPWVWYFRHHTRIGYTSYDGSPPRDPPDSEVVLVHSSNKKDADPVLAGQFTEGQRIRHRWWFPESYRDLTIGKLLGALVDRDAWLRAKDYFLHRKISTGLGSEDAYLYFSSDFEPVFEPSL